MRREHWAWAAFIGLVLIVGTQPLQGAIVPYGLDEIPESLVRTPGTIIVDYLRVPLAVPSLGRATTTQDYVPDLLPVSERMYQDRHWGYWLGFSSGNGYSFVLNDQCSWGHDSSTNTFNTAAPATQVPEPASLILLGLGGAWMAASTRRRR